MAKCRKCDRDANHCRGWLERVNEKGVPGIWECRPSCEGEQLTQERAVLGAIGGEPKRRKSRS